MIEAFRGSVNRWECDENDHQNVRFYVDKMVQTLAAALVELPGYEHVDVPAALRGIESQHMRFIKEARTATPMIGYAGLVACDGERSDILTELRHGTSDDLLAAFVTTLRTPGAPWVAPLDLPAWAGPRGLTAEPLPCINLAFDDAGAAGFAPIGRGVVKQGECNVLGELEHFQAMGRVSDSMPNLWRRFQDEAEEAARDEGALGGAVVEYRMHWHEPLIAGSRFVVTSGIRAVGSKTQHFAHLVYNLDSGRCAVSCEAIGVMMDLEARRAVEIPAPRRERMLARLLQLPG